MSFSNYLQVIQYAIRVFNSATTALVILFVHFVEPYCQAIVQRTATIDGR